MAKYECPQCGDSEHIDICALVRVRLFQYDETGEDFSTDADESADGSHEWDRNSGATCATCGFGGNVDQFDTEKRK